MESDFATGKISSVSVSTSFASYNAIVQSLPMANFPLQHFNEAGDILAAFNRIFYISDSIKLIANKQSIPQKNF